MASTEIWHVDGTQIKVSSLDKVYWPEDGLTKGDALHYYRAVAPIMLPHLKDRPVTLRAFPRGIRQPGYYRRDMPERAPAWLRSVDYQPETVDHTTQLPVVDDEAGLIWFANQGSIEFHTWGVRVPELDEPDQAIFDLDPGDQASFADVLRAALRLWAALDPLGLRAYPKTSGGSGLHVHVPLAPGYSFDQVRAWVRSLTEQLAEASPDLIAVAHGATHRGREVTIDHAQNSIGRNTAAPYTLRARPGAPVSAPLKWEEVEAGQVSPADFNLRTIPDRLKQVGDLFEPVLKADQVLPA